MACTSMNANMSLFLGLNNADRQLLWLLYGIGSSMGASDGSSIVRFYRGARLITSCTVTTIVAFQKKNG